MPKSNACPVSFPISRLFRNRHLGGKLIDDKSSQVWPDIRLYLNNSNLKVEFVSMTTMFGLTVLDQGNSWTYGTDKDLSKYVFPNYSVWSYDWTNEDDTPGSGAHIDPANEIEWEIDLVQRWMKGEVLEFSDLVQTCDLVGIRAYLDSVELAPREEAVIFGRYGIQDGVERDWQELADQLGVSPDRVKEVAAEALERLISFDESMAIVCSRTPTARMNDFDLEELRETAWMFWNSEISHYQFTQLGLKLDTICYLSFLYILSDYFNMEHPGLLEVPEGSIEVASNIDLLLGTLSRRMLSSNPHTGFSQSSQFNLEKQNWSALLSRAIETDNKLKKLSAEKVDVRNELESWDFSSLLDCYAVSLQISELFDSKDAQDLGGQTRSPLYYFLTQEQRTYGLVKAHLEAELRNR